jgi:hypothetical protein
LVRLAKELMEGQAPKAAQGGALYNKRPTTLLLPEATAVEQGAAELMRGS